MTISFLVLTAIAYLPYWLEKRSCNQPYTWEDMLNLTKDEADYMRRVNGGERSTCNLKSVNQLQVERSWLYLWRSTFGLHFGGLTHE